MKRTYIKSTATEVEQMRRLYKAGFKCTKIARIFKKDHSSILYWVKDKNKTPEKNNDEGISCNYDIELLIKNKEIENEEKRRKKIIEVCCCKACGKERKGKWKQTKWCSMHCWDLKTQKEKKPFLHF